MPLASSYAEYYGAASAAEIIAAIKADPELGTAGGGLVANAALSVNQTTKDAVRACVGGRWADEDGAAFDLTITEIPQ